jgi:hypothetical protein
MVGEFLGGILEGIGRGTSIMRGNEVIFTDVNTNKVMIHFRLLFESLESNSILDCKRS